MEINEIITLVISTIAIFIAVLSYFQAKKINRRSLRIEKLEEILEITHIFKNNYHYFEDTFELKKNLIKANKGDFTDKIYQIQVEDLIRISEDMKLRDKLARLYVLNNSYLPKSELKEKIGVLISCYSSLAHRTISKPFKEQDLIFNKYPKRWDMSEYITEIQNEIIEEMKLGYKKSISDKNNYENKFKNRFNL